MFSNTFRLLTGGGFLLPLLLPSVLEAAVLKTAEEAIRLAFPQAQVDSHTIFLTAEQKAEAQRALGGPVPGLLLRYRIREQERLVALGYVDTHRVRTLTETLLVLVSPSGEVLRVEVLAFAEPLEYLPRETWYQQFRGTTPASPPQLGANLRPVTGATLSAHAAAEAVRRVLVLHRVVTP